MKHFAIAVFVAVIGLGMMVQDAEAKRFGGGSSSGMRRDSSVMKRDAIPPKPVAPSQAAAPAPAPKPGMSRWLGPLAGLAAGIGLASLFSHFGMGEGMANVFMFMALAMAALFLVRWFMSRRQNDAGLQYAAAGAPAATPLRPVASSAPASFDAATAVAASAPDTAQAPAGFDVDGFLRQAKLNFIRLQAANDRGDLDDIRQFTSPEMFAEVKLQFEERGKQSQQTDVVELKASLLDVSDDAARQLASVRFHGLLREQADAAPEAFSEVWHLTRPHDGSQNWLVAGIQQD